MEKMRGILLSALVLLQCSGIECKVSQVVHGKFPVFELRSAFLSSASISNNTRPLFTPTGGLEALASSINPRGFDFSKLHFNQKEIISKDDEVIPLAWVDLPQFDTPTFSAFSGNAINTALVPVKEKIYKKVFVKSNWDEGSDSVDATTPVISSAITTESARFNPATEKASESHSKNVVVHEEREQRGVKPTAFQSNTNRLGRVIPLSSRRNDQQVFNNDGQSRITSGPTTQPRQTTRSPVSPRFPSRPPPSATTQVPVIMAKVSTVRTSHRPVVAANPFASKALQQSASFLQPQRKLPPPTASSSSLPTASSYQYQYQYKVSNQDTMDVKTHSESSQGGTVVGEYSILEPDGYTIRTVTYTADENGFRASVKRVRKS